MARAILLFKAKRLGLARVSKFETRPTRNCLQLSIQKKIKLRFQADTMEHGASARNGAALLPLMSQVIHIVRLLTSSINPGLFFYIERFRDQQQ
jgi:hypothetical protein